MTPTLNYWSFKSIHTIPFPSHLCLFFAWQNKRKVLQSTKALECNCVPLSVYNYLRRPNTLGVAQEWKQTGALGVHKAVKTCLKRTIVHMFSFGEPEALQSILNLIKCLIETISGWNVTILWQWKQHESGNEDTHAFICHLHHMSSGDARCTPQLQDFLGIELMTLALLVEPCKA